jgi:AraC-like DNA-binding protein
MITKDSLKTIPHKRKIIDGSDKFAYVLPCKELTQWISNFTISFPDQESIPDNYTVMPHASVTLVYYHNETGLHNMVFGATSEPKTVGNLANKCDVIFIIEFQPAGFYPFSCVQQSELLNGIYSLSSFNSSINRKIQKLFLEEDSVEKLFSSVEELLLDSIQEAYPEALILAIQLITQSLGTISLNKVAKMVAYSDRQLNRFFNEYLGLSIKSFSRIVRINHALRLLNDRSHSISMVWDTLGYYDSSHFAKDFKLVCGVTPNEYRKNMSDFYNEVAKF